jgi:hypothetical protein
MVKWSELRRILKNGQMKVQTKNSHCQMVWLVENFQD